MRNNAYKYVMGNWAETNLCQLVFKGERNKWQLLTVHVTTGDHLKKSIRIEILCEQHWPVKKAAKNNRNQCWKVRMELLPTSPHPLSLKTDFPWSRYRCDIVNRLIDTFPGGTSLIIPQELRLIIWKRMFCEPFRFCSFFVKDDYLGIQNLEIRGIYPSFENSSLEFKWNARIFIGSTARGISEEH